MPLVVERAEYFAVLFGVGTNVLLSHILFSCRSITSYAQIDFREFLRRSREIAGGGHSEAIGEAHHET